MSELREHRWAVISERGCEATRISYDDSLELVRRLRAEKVSGLCIVTDAAASRLKPANPTTNNKPTSRKQKR